MIETKYKLSKQIKAFINKYTNQEKLKLNIRNAGQSTLKLTR